MAETKAQFWNRTTFMVITGASQGLGKQLAIEFSRSVAPDSTILLLARTLPKLETTKKEILEINPTLNVKVLSVDLSKPDLEQFEEILAPFASDRKYELYFLVHNAASVSCQTPATEMKDINTWNEYMTLNLYSVALLTSAFLKYFKDGERCLLNISSLAALVAFKGMAFYCVGKASREMYFKTLAEEDPSLNILNYSPGPLKTDMLDEIANSCCNSDTKSTFTDMINKDNYVKIEDTVKKVIDVLGRRCYTSPGRIDFYDR
ncbi:sepiapterin reductase [Planococcus citri]|uniref:sepiapterin reductase n=1 Tax=Planococcus citri TaxID=170843 RepID=UPI0031F98D95